MSPQDTSTTEQPSAFAQAAQARHVATMAAYRAPTPAHHLRVHHLKVATLMLPKTGQAAPLVPLVLDEGAAWVVLEPLARALGAPVQAFEAAAQAWAATLAPHAKALAPLWVAGYPLAPVPCLRWPLLRAFLAQWIPPAPSVARQCLLDALGEDSQQGEPDVLGTPAPQAGRPEKVSADKVREVYRLKELMGQTWMEVASATQLGASTCREIAAGRYPFSSPTAKDAWRETFGAKT
ncbi:MAG: hypothetical protein JSR68_08305 [Proteobacteria bacterium]|nr:hypothetical protein [Pseudomonadota bacterium]